MRDDDELKLEMQETLLKRAITAKKEEKYEREKMTMVIKEANSFTILLFSSLFL